MVSLETYTVSYGQEPYHRLLLSASIKVIGAVINNRVKAFEQEKTQVDLDSVPFRRHCWTRR